MKLKAYLKKNELTLAEFARIVRASEFGVRKWISGERRPRADAIRRISDATQGLVGPSDFFETDADDSVAKLSSVAPL